MLDRFQSIDFDLLGLNADSRVLDLGCGTGRHTLEASKHPGRVCGVDLLGGDILRARYLLEIMRRRGEVQAEVHWLLGEGLHLPFVDGTFTHAFCTETLEHVPDDHGIVRELARVLRPGGTLVVSVPDCYSENILWTMSWKYRNIPGGHIRIYNRRDIADLMRSEGLEVRATRYRHGLEALFWIVQVGVRDDWDKPVAKWLRRYLNSVRSRRSDTLTRIDALANWILPKSIVVYARKPVAGDGDRPPWQANSDWVTLHPGERPSG